MATQVKPRLIQPKRFTGHQKSADVIRNQPAYSIRARDHASQTEAECMAAIYTCKAGTKKMLGKKGRPCMKRDRNVRDPLGCQKLTSLGFSRPNRVNQSSSVTPTQTFIP